MTSTGFVLFLILSAAGLVEIGGVYADRDQCMEAGHMARLADAGILEFYCVPQDANSTR